MNILRDAINFFRMQAGFIFTPQDADPPFRAGTVALWYNRLTDHLRLSSIQGRVGDVATLGAVANNDVHASIPIERPILIPAGPTATIDMVLANAEQVVDVVLQKMGAAGGGAGTVQLINATTGVPISDAMSINVPARAVVRAQSIDPGQSTIAANAPLRLVRTRGQSTDESCIAFVRTLRRS
jgi:hypothetical protein